MKFSAACFVIGLSLSIWSIFSAWNYSPGVDPNPPDTLGSLDDNRHIAFYNGVTNAVVLSIDGPCSNNKDNVRGKLVVVCKTGPDTYQTLSLNLPDDVTYVVEGESLTTPSKTVLSIPSIKVR